MTLANHASRPPLRISLSSSSSSLRAKSVYQYHNILLGYRGAQACRDPAFSSRWSLNLGKIKHTDLLKNAFGGRRQPSQPPPLPPPLPPPERSLGTVCMKK